MLWTIGHSNHTTEQLVTLLKQNDIGAVVDVRSSPFSRYNPHFNREPLAASLGGVVRYAWMGDVIGGRPPDPSFYDEAGHVLYGPLSRTPEFVRGLAQLERNMSRYRIALLCSEAEPAECHRHLLVCRSLRDRGLPAEEIAHILADGSVRSEAQMVTQGRMLEDVWRSPLSVLPEPALNPSSRQ